MRVWVWEGAVGAHSLGCYPYVYVGYRQFFVVFVFFLIVGVAIDGA